MIKGFHHAAISTPDLERCIEYATRATRADPLLANAHVALGYAYWRSGRIEEAIEEEATAARLDPGSFGNYFLGACHCELGDYESALEHDLELSRAGLDRAARACLPAQPPGFARA